MSEHRIICVGLNPAIDRVLEVPNFVIGGHLEGEQKLRQPAGKALNVARTLAKWNQPTLMTGFLGEAERELFHHFLHQPELQCIHPYFTLVSGSTRENITIIDRVRNTDTHLRSRGFAVDGKHWQQFEAGLLTMCRKGDVVVISGSLPQGVEVAMAFMLIEKIRSLGSRLVLDVAGDLLKRVLEKGGEGLLLIKPNVREIKQAMGEVVQPEQQPMNEEQMWELADRVRGSTQGVNHVVISMGAQGAMLLHQGQVWHAWIENLGQRVVDTVGCGDALLGAMLHEVMGNTDELAMLRTGQAAGAANAVVLGAGNYDLKMLEQMAGKVMIRQCVRT